MDFFEFICQVWVHHFQLSATPFQCLPTMRVADLAIWGQIE